VDEELDRDRAREKVIAREEDLAHLTAPERAQQAVLLDARRRRPARPGDDHRDLDRPSAGLRELDALALEAVLLELGREGAERHADEARCARAVTLGRLERLASSPLNP
jgi:hypothetical protein